MFQKLGNMFQLQRANNRTNKNLATCLSYNDPTTERIKTWQHVSETWQHVSATTSHNQANNTMKFLKHICQVFIRSVVGLTMARCS